jgi:hypothetical protein
MNLIGKIAFPLVFAATVIATFVFFTTPGAVPAMWLFFGYLGSFAAGALHPGDKTRLQLMFLAAGAGLASATIAQGCGWGGWVGVGACVFLVLTMKLDGGDRYGG